MRKLLAILLPFWVLTITLAQENKPLAHAGISTCEYPNSGGGMSKWVTAGTGLSAAVELRVRVTGKDKQRLCVTSWVLHLRGKSGNLPAIKVAEREDLPDGDEWQQENSFEVKGWSRNGKMVLASQIQAQGDWDETTPIIFDFSSNRKWRVDLFPLFEKLIPSGCSVVYRPLRFGRGGRVLITATSTDRDREAGTKPCFADSLWQLDFRHHYIAPVSVQSSDK